MATTEQNIVGDELAARAARVIPGGVNSGQRQVPGLEELVIAATKGATFTDGQGRTYTDYHAAFGPPHPRPQRPGRRRRRRLDGEERRADGRGRHRGRGRARRAALLPHSLGRARAPDRDGQRGDLPRDSRRARGHRPPARDQVPGLLPRLARLGRDERDLAARARRAEGSALEGEHPRRHRRDDRLQVQRRGRGRARARRPRRRRDHPRADPAQHRRGAPAARLPRAPPRARDEARNRPDLRRGGHRASATRSAATSRSPASRPT